MVWSLAGAACVLAGRAQAQGGAAPDTPPAASASAPAANASLAPRGESPGWFGRLLNRSADTTPREERVRITDPYIELHTGPGRGYPVYYVAEREAWIAIELRHTDWYKVRTENGKQGWVHREQLASTLTEAGSQQTFRDVLLDDYLRRRVDVGAAYGRFQSEPMIKLWAGYRLSDTLSIEGAISQVQGIYSGSSLWQVNLTTEPWFDQRLSPFFGIGVGRFNNVPNKSLVDASVTDVTMGDATFGVRYHLSDRFVLRADYTIYSVFLSDRRSGEYRALTAGLSFFF